MMEMNSKMVQECAQTIITSYSCPCCKRPLRIAAAGPVFSVDSKFKFIPSDSSGRISDQNSPGISSAEYERIRELCESKPDPHCQENRQ